MHLRFDYVNSKGERSTRTVRDIDIRGPYHIDAFCELRQADRTFDMLSISNVFDLEKNAPVEDIQDLLGMLNKDGSLKKKYEDFEPPLPRELHCKNCGADHEIEDRWAKQHDRFVCNCGRCYPTETKRGAEGKLSPAPIKFKCPKCHTNHALDLAWIKKSQRFVCGCGQSFSFEMAR